MLQIFALLFSLTLLMACRAPAPPPPVQPLQEADLTLLSGGDTTNLTVLGRDAFAQPLANLSQDRRDQFFSGHQVFLRNWVTAPASAEGFDGLGPLFNAVSCASCHARDGRGRPPLREDEKMLSMLIRLSIPGQSEHGGPVAEPHYGLQLNPAAILGVAAEGVAKLTFRNSEGAFADGTPWSLISPNYQFDTLAYGPLANDVRFSPRVAPPLHGLGLLEAVDEALIRSMADDNDANGDGISGRVNEVWSERAQGMALGRFGWKANEPNLFQQTAGAALGDMGVTTSLFPHQNCTAAQRDCQNAFQQTTPEMDDRLLESMVFYMHTLAPPAVRNVNDARAKQGQALFVQAQCSSCHTPTLKTGTLPGYPELSGQTIKPYTDLLLHDMGADLADGRDDYKASGQEWRTPPLWGIGLTEQVNGHTRFMHDGRARNLTEAIVWHGGEASHSKQLFLNMTASERAALLFFLESL